MNLEQYNLFCPDGHFHFGNIEFENGKITRIYILSDEENPSADFLVPGFIDSHFHGCNGYDFSDGTVQAIHELARFQLLHGVTSICPATMTLPEKELERICNAVRKYSNDVSCLKVQKSSNGTDCLNEQKSSNNADCLNDQKSSNNANCLNDQKSSNIADCLNEQKSSNIADCLNEQKSSNGADSLKVQNYVTETAYVKGYKKTDNTPASINKSANSLAADFLGFYMEGPFFSAEKAGAQRKDCLQNPDINLYYRLQNLCGKQIKVWALAPELPGSVDFIRECPVSISLGHTVAVSEDVANAFDAGARRITHLYNGMLHPEDFLRIGSLYQDCYAELICDGCHNSKERVLAAWEQFGEDRIILISDSMRATGLGDGTYTLGGQEVFVQGKLALLASGNKAGSVSTLYDCFCTAVSLGIPLKAALKAVTCNPAKALGLDSSIGKLAFGCNADFLILDRQLEIKDIYKNGTSI